MQTQKSETTTTTTKAAALERLILARQAEREAARAEAEQQERERAEQNRQEALDRMARWAMNHISADLRQALDIRVQYDQEAAALLDNGEDGRAPAYLTFNACDETWTIQQDYYQYRYEYLLRGGDGYTKIVTPEYSAYDITPDILDALAECPAWLEKAEERKAAEAERERKREEERQQKEAQRATRRPDRVYHHENQVLGFTKHGVLGADRRVTAMIHNPSDVDHATSISGRITDHTSRWLVIQPDDEAAPSYLIPITRVIYIRPLS